MKPIGPNSNSYDKTLNDFKEKSPLFRSENIDPAPGFTQQPPDNQNNIGLGVPSDWTTDVFTQKIGLGSQNNCDPFQSGSIVNDLETPNRNTIYRYSKSVRACDEAVMDLFRNLVVID